MIFTHSLRSDWNHGHVHFLRGVVRGLLARGHEVVCYEPEHGWSADNLRRDHGAAALESYREAYPDLARVVRPFDPRRLQAGAAVQGADLVIVQEWTDRTLVDALVRARDRDGGFRLLFHDAHHRSVTRPAELRALGIERFDGVLAFGEVVRQRYREEGWSDHPFTWHEAADVQVFRPRTHDGARKDLVWVGNWGDGERTAEFDEYLFGPARDLGLSGAVYGVRYPAEGRQAVARAGLQHKGYLPNHRVPWVYGAHRLTMHLPRRAYRTLLPGIPTIRVFEALACGIPLLSSPWDDSEGLFDAGHDHLVAEDGREMRELVRTLLDDPEQAAALAGRGLAAVRRRHTTEHRVEELLDIDARLRGGLYPARTAEPSTHATDAAARSPPVGSLRAPAGDAAPRVAFFGSSLVSSYWNGAATYYRGILRALSKRGWRVTFYEPDAWDRQAHRDMPDPAWARVVVYPAEGHAGVDAALRDARGADLVVKASGVGVHDAYLEVRVLDLQADGSEVAFWDVDAPATLARLAADPDDPFAALVPRYDYVFTYGGGPPVVRAYGERGAARCVPVYNGLDPDTHRPVAPEPRYAADLSLLANRLPDRESRIDRFFLDPARARPDLRFLLGGNGWSDRALPANVRAVGHVSTRDHNAWNASARLVLNVHRDSMASVGWSPATRVFEAVGSAACLVSDAAPGLERFFEPGREILLAEDGEEVVSWLDTVDADEARRIGARARQRALREHTYDRRVEDVLKVLGARREVLV